MRGAFLAGVIALTCVAIYAGGRAVAGVGTKPAERVSVDAPRSPRPESIALPLVFEENRGQGGAPERFDFLVRCRGYHAFVSSGEVVFSFDGAPLSMTTVGATPREPDVVDLALASRSNYFFGNEPSKWITEVPHVRGARYRNTTRGVSWTFGGRGRALEFAFDVASGAETPQLRLDGATSVALEGDGDLRVAMPHGVATFSKPVAWQWERDAVTAAWTVADGGVIRVELGAHDSDAAVHVDPTVTYESYIGGDQDDTPCGVKFDASGNVYVAGNTRVGTANYPVTTGAFNSTRQSAGIDGFVTKFSPGGTSLVYSTYIGTPTDDTMDAFAVDGSGNAYLAGFTGNTSYPTTPGAWMTTKPVTTAVGVAVLTKFSTTGASLVWSTYTNPGFLFSAMCLDSSNNLVLAGSGICRKFASDGGSFLWNNSGIALSSPVWFRAVCTDAADNIYVAGSVIPDPYSTIPDYIPTSINPLPLPGFQRQHAGSGDAVLMKITPAMKGVFTTYVGGSGVDTGTGVGVNLAGQPYVVGQTASANFPVTSDAYQTPASGTHAFLTRFSADGLQLRYSTVLRGAGTDGATGVAVHPTGSCVVIGNTSSTTDFPISNAFQSTYGGGAQDGFALKLERDGTLGWSSFFGGSAADSGLAIGMTPNGTVALAGTSASNDLPMVSPYQSQRIGLTDAAVLKIPDNLPTTLTIPQVSGTLLDWTVGVAFSQQLAATEGLSPYTWSMPTGSPPPGLVFSADGLLSGAPSKVGDHPFTVRVKDSCDLVSPNGVLTLHVNPLPTFAAATLPDRTIGVAIDQSLSFSGGTGALVVSLDSGALPAGVSLDAKGRVSGTPENAGDFSFTARVTDSLGGTTTRPFTMRVNGLPSIDEFTFADWTEGVVFLHDFTASGGTGAFTWAMTAGPLPVDAEIDAMSGRMAGAVRSTGEYPFTLRATDTLGVSAERSFTMRTMPYPQILTQSVPLAFEGRPYSVRIETAGGTPPATLELDPSFVGSLFPDGLVLSDARISGIPVRADRKFPTLTYTDTHGAFARRAFVLEVAGRLDVVARRTAERITIDAGAHASFKRYLDLLEGTAVTVSLKLKGKGVFSTDLAVAANDGSTIDVSAFKKTTPKSVTISKFPVPASGRYVLSIVRGPESDGQATLSVSISPQSKWPGTGVVAAAGLTEFAFSAPPGAVATIVAKAAKGSAALPRIVAVLDEDGVDVAAGVVAREKGGSAALKLAAPLAGGRYRVRFVGRDGTAGAITWSVGLKRPKTYDFALPELGAGDGF